MREALHRPTAMTPGSAASRLSKLGGAASGSRNSSNSAAALRNQENKENAVVSGSSTGKREPGAQELTSAATSSK